VAKRKKVSQNTQSPLEVSLLRIKSLLSDQEFGSLLDELKQPLKSAIRLNQLKVKPEIIDQWKKAYGWQLEQVPFCKTGFQVNKAETLPSQTLEHRMGMFYIQDAASMLPVELFSFEDDPHPLILDLAASPGGKTTHLIGNSNDQGFVLANDSSRERIQALRIVMQNWGGVNCAISCFPGEKFGQWFPETFDQVLLDAPCSMEGLRSTEAHPLRPISDRERLSLARRQEALLESALQAVRVGGQFVYSTCTLAPEEDESVIDHLLRKYTEQIRIDPNPLPTQIPPALTQYNSTQYLPEVAQAIRLWPYQFHTAGFFAARFTKVDSINHQVSILPERSLEDAGWNALESEDENAIISEFMNVYGCDLRALLERYDLTLWQRGATLYLFPGRYLQNFNGLPVQSLGMVLAEKKENGNLPSHEFCSRFFREFHNNIFQISESDAARWLMGSDLPQGLIRAEIGKYILLANEMNRFIGLGKVNRDRIKNLLPRRLIRNNL
jgi:16S rRNA (cytosine1407-C5)-methyltransferase